MGAAKRAWTWPVPFLLAIVAGVWVCLPSTAAGQDRREDASLPAAVRALGHGQTDEAERLLRSLDAKDPEVVAVRARLLVRRGRAAEAEALLAPSAARFATSGAALELGLLFRETGRADEARRTLEPILAAAGGFHGAGEYLRAARAARALGKFESANDYFREAAAAAPSSAPIETAWGELFLEKHNRQDASRSFEAALQGDPQWAPAHLGLARVAADDSLVSALASVARALAIDPGLVDGYVFMGELLLAQGETAAARTQIDRALALDPHSLAAHRLLATAAYAAGRTAEYEAELAKVREVNPRDGEVFRLVAAQLARDYQFDEAVRMAREAVAADSGSAKAYADLGMHLLRTGDEAGARLALDRAAAIDPYDVVTYNLLELLDTIRKFTTVSDAPFVVRLDPADAPVFGEYLLPFAREALRKLSALYGVQAPSTILIEVFSRHDDFAVRTAGLPGMAGALGACFGRVITMDSPRARQPGTFDWRATLWHEMAHVVTLQLSKQRVPRWLTEGISVFEEKRAQPEWARRMEPELVDALEQRRAPVNLREMNAAFANPSTAPLAYYTASLVVEHLIDRYGQAGLRKVLAAYAEGLDTDAAFRTGLGAGVDAVQASFSQALDARLAPLRLTFRAPAGLSPDRASLDELKAAAAADPASFPVQLALGRALRSSGDPAAAVEPLERAAALAPMVVGKDSPRTVMADIALEQGENETAAAWLEQELGYDPANVELARRLAGLLEPLGDRARLDSVYERIAALDPFDAAAHTVLGRAALERQDAPAAVREFKVAIAAGAGDLAAAHCDLAEAWMLAGHPADAKREVLAALEIAPTYDRGQDLLLKLVDRDATRGDDDTRR